MMTIGKAAIIGAVQGVTEFLPISSSGHSVIAQELLSIASHDLALDVLTHAATGFVVLTLYRRELITLAKGFLTDPLGRRKDSRARVGWMVALACLPAGVVGICFRRQVEILFNNAQYVGVALCATALMLLLASRRIRSQEDTDGDVLADVSALPWTMVLILGVAQALAIAPGISRSGMTIAVALLLGIRVRTAIFFSFLMVVPLIFGASALELLSLQATHASPMPLIVGSVVAYGSGLVGFRLLKRAFCSGTIEFFSFYLSIVGGVVIGHTAF